MGPSLAAAATELAATLDLFPEGITPNTSWESLSDDQQATLTAYENLQGAQQALDQGLNTSLPGMLQAEFAEEGFSVEEIEQYVAAEVAARESNLEIRAEIAALQLDCALANGADSPCYGNFGLEEIVVTSPTSATAEIANPNGSEEPSEVTPKTSHATVDVDWEVLSLRHNNRWAAAQLIAFGNTVEIVVDSTPATLEIEEETERELWLLRRGYWTSPG
jgi:hypothetical protein